MTSKKISSKTLALLNYWRAALADSCLVRPDIPEICEPIKIGEVNGSWRVTQAPNGWIKQIYSASKLDRQDEDGNKKPIPVILAPALYMPESSHGIRHNAASHKDALVPLCIPCLLTPNGELLPDPDKFPWIPRDMLEPSIKDITIGTLEDLDEFLSDQSSEPQSIPEIIQIAADLFDKVAGTDIPLLKSDLNDDVPAFLSIENYFVKEGWFCLPYEPSPPAVHIIGLCDRITDQSPAAPLLETLAHMPDRPAQPPLKLISSEARIKNIVGHINQRYPLSVSQAEAMVELENISDGEILAVNGPPGTGKTTLLQSVVAQKWIMAAINHEPCPIITATSTNVKAVENVLDSFAKLGQDNSHERWLPDIGGFGIFLASASRDSDHPVYNNPKEHYFRQFESQNYLSRATTHYLNCAKNCAFVSNKATSILDTVDALRESLQAYQSLLEKFVSLRFKIVEETDKSETTGAITSITNTISAHQKEIDLLRREIELAEEKLDACKEQHNREKLLNTANLEAITTAESSWHSYAGSFISLLLDMLSFIPPVKRALHARDRAFLLSHPLTSSMQNRSDKVAEHFFDLKRTEKIRSRGILDGIEAREKEALKQKKIAKQYINNYQEQINRLKELDINWRKLLKSFGKDNEEYLDLALTGLNGVLDIKIRALMFKLADWYWSGKWLLEMEDKLRGNIEDSKSPQKLEVMLRRFAKLTPCMVSNFHMVPSFFCGWMGAQPLPLWNLIDLLIVDEAGQVSPEVGAPTFALAKQAVVVGDVYQIEPIWNVCESIDRANAVKFKLVKKWDDPQYEKMHQDGYTAAKGNLMLISARACKVQKYPDVRGLLLTEHRRCVPELIAYCNELVYSGRLEPKRPAIPQSERILPAYGYLSVVSQSQKVGGSRKNFDEAKAIVDWIVEHRNELENHYGNLKSGEPEHISKILAVITPFSPQATLISNLLKKALPDTKKRGLNITVGTVHRLQGGERHVVIFSPVYGHDHKGGMFFDKGRNMLNVAISRAKDSFLVMGNLNLFDAKKDGLPSGLLGKYLFRSEDSSLSKQIPFEGAREYESRQGGDGPLDRAAAPA